MKRLLAIAVICTALIGEHVGSLAQDDVEELLEVSQAVICREITDRQPVEPGVRFPAAVGRLYCYSRLSNVSATATIVHAWVFGDTERARVELPVHSPAWRTFSSKRIMPHEVGRWRVDILDQDGNVLKTLCFDVVP